MIRRLSLTQRLGAMVALLLLVCGAASIALQMRASEAQAQEAIQRLSLNLARQIAGTTTRHCWRRTASTTRRCTASSTS